MRTLHRAHTFKPLRPSHGAIPPELDGRLYRLGPGKFEDEAGTYPHWFDGEGLITSIDLSKGTASAACRLINPAETSKAQLWQRGRFGRLPKGFLRCLRSLYDPDLVVNPANTALMVWRGRMFALYEGYLPTEINADSLETIGQTSLGVVRQGFGAHPKLHRRTGAQINQGFRTPWKPHLDYFVLPELGDARLLASIPFSGSFLTHDFAVTDRFIVSFCCPLFPDVSTIVLGQKPTSQALKWRPERGTEVLVTSVDGASAGRRLKTSAFFYSHTANAFENGEEIIVYGATASDADALGWLGSIRSDASALAPSTIGRMTEIKINPKTEEITRRTVADCAFDYPVIDTRYSGKRHRFMYGAGFCDEQMAYRDLFDCLVKIDLEKGAVTKRNLGRGHFVSEPIFVPHPGATDEGRGWLLCLNYNANSDESYVAIFDAEQMETVAVIPVGQPLPLSFHGLWVDRAWINGRHKM